MQFTAPRRFEGNCSTCDEYGHISLFCAVGRGFKVVRPHVNVVTTEGEGNHEGSGQEYVAAAAERPGTALAHAGALGWRRIGG